MRRPQLAENLSMIKTLVFALLAAVMLAHFGCNKPIKEAETPRQEIQAIAQR